MKIIGKHDQYFSFWWEDFCFLSWQDDSFLEKNCWWQKITLKRGKCLRLRAQFLKLTYQIWKGCRQEVGCMNQLAVLSCGVHWARAGGRLEAPLSDCRKEEILHLRMLLWFDQHYLSWSFKNLEAWLLHTSLHSLKNTSHQNHLKNSFYI